MTTMNNDPIENLERFRRVDQRHHDRAYREIAAGRKTTDWIWFVFPQVAGLGRSIKSRRYAFNALREATGFFMDPTLYQRYSSMVELVYEHWSRASDAEKGTVLEKIFGELDARKFCSSLTIFALICHQFPGSGPEVGHAIEMLDFDDRWCQHTITTMRNW